MNITVALARFKRRTYHLLSRRNCSIAVFSLWIVCVVFQHLLQDATFRIKRAIPRNVTQSQVTIVAHFPISILGFHNFKWLLKFCCLILSFAQIVFLQTYLFFGSLYISLK
jgi:hypothetical protein